MSRISDKIKKYISCPQFGDENYGQWGILTLEERRLIKELAETCDMFEETADYFAKENKELEHRLSNCIEPKFMVGQELYWVYTSNQRFPFKVKVLGFVIKDLGGIRQNLYEIEENEIDMGCYNEKQLFATEEEAKAKLEELKK